MSQTYTGRRDFLKLLAIGGGGIVIMGKFRFLFANESTNGVLKAIVVDFSRCTGCRTCETVCSAIHHPVIIGNEKFNGLGNPKLANIRVHHYNPDVDVPTVCSNCPDAPCVYYCPSDPDIVSGHKAIYRDPFTLAILTNHEVCLSCGTCARACAKDGAGIIVMNPETDFPEHICDHCGGNPQCVKYCPYGALSFFDVDIKNEYFGLTHEEIAEKLIHNFYTE